MLWGVFVQAPVCLVVTCVSCPSQGLAGGYLCVLSRSGFGQRLPVCLVTVRVWPEATCWPFVVALDRMFDTIEHMQNNIWLHVNRCGLQT